MFWRRKKTPDPLDDSRFAPAGSAAPTPDASPVAPPPAAGGSTLLIEDAFTITGRGTAVTGAVQSGVLRAGQQVAVYRGGQAIAASEIQSISVSGKVIDVAQAGEDVGLLLPGLSRDMLQPGDQVVAAG